jgi:hypothetical protein
MAMLAIVILFSGITASGQYMDPAPQVIAYQGRLTNAAGDPVADGSHLVKFIIWNDPVATAPANEKWNNGFQTITTTDGLFSYNLGSHVALLPDVFVDSALWLGITVGTDPEISPRTKLTTQAFSFHSVFSNSAEYASVASNANNLEGQSGSYYLDWFNFTGIPAGFADGIDNEGSGDITAVNAGSGLSGGGATGDVTLSIPTDGITASHIADNTIANADISPSAAIEPTKISGTAAALSATQTFTGSSNRFDGDVYFSDSTMRVNSTGILIGSGVSVPSSSYLIYMNRNYNRVAESYGINVNLQNAGIGSLYGISSYVKHTAGSTGYAYGLFGRSETDCTYRYGLYGHADAVNADIASGSSIGVYGIAYDGAIAYGVYGYASSATTNYAGYFHGNVHVSGTLSKGGGSFRIDHPLDPENKYLQHSFIESPDMMNVYNGNIVTDHNGYAEVELPDYFEVLNKDFRYQLTVIGEFAQAIISNKISGNRFSIRTDKPNIEVSWQVTGIRQDKWAEANRVQVELDKKPEEIGKYAHPEVWNQPVERGIDYENNKQSAQSERPIGDNK